MKSDLGLIHIGKVIVHDVPARPVGGGGQPLRLSEIESELNTELRNYFRERVVASLTAASFDVEFDPDSASPVPELVLDNLGSQETDFVAMSTTMANHLYNTQTGAMSPGLLCIVQSQLEGRPGLAVLKLEREAAVRLEENEVEGKTTFNLEHLRDLVLTERAAGPDALMSRSQPRCYESERGIKRESFWSTESNYADDSQRKGTMVYCVWSIHLMWSSPSDLSMEFPQEHK